jgi:aspartyl-tRNA(Asn)/glutamyl-tRNA(Gln) amidotransferase subunit C
MSVSVEDVRHVATLARLGLTDERAAALTRELNTILEHMAVLSTVSTDAVSESSVFGLTGLQLCKDHGSAAPLREPPESFAPSMRAGFFLVPRLASHEDPEPSA